MNDKIRKNNQKIDFSDFMAFPKDFQHSFTSNLNNFASATLKQA